jgi:molybdopterin synthase sulfur carrier subunit
MKISVKYFANMRETMGKAEESVELGDGATVAALWSSVSDTAMPENTLIAVNMEYTNADHALNDGDEVGFFPPVTGG